MKKIILVAMGSLERRRVSAALMVGERSYARWLYGDDISPLSRVRIETGLRALGRDDLISAVADVRSGK